MMATDLLCSPHRYSVTPNLDKQFPKRALQRTCITWPVRCSLGTETSPLTANRRSANYQPATWSYEFVQSLKNDHMVETYEDNVKTLEKKVRSMFTNEDRDLVSKLELIDHVQHLGLGYRFEEDMKRALSSIISSGRLHSERVKSLHVTALSFRLQRQHGYEVSQDVFESFRDREGNFKRCLCNDVKGMLSLQEASYLGFERENLLDKARVFTSTHLKDLKRDISKSLEEQVRHSLELPLHRRMLRLEARWYIEQYKIREDANPVLLELAILDFNIVQSMLQRDLKDMSRWWEEMGLANKLSFARDRLTECYFWTVGIVYEPQFSNCRKGLTKLAALVTTIDDVYDVYGTLEELEIFTDVVQRWDIIAATTLPQYMKLCFLALYNTVNEMVYETLKEKGEDILPYLTKAVMGRLCKVFLQEAKWNRNKYRPSFDQYLENAWLSSSGALQLVFAYWLMTPYVTIEALEGLKNYHSLLRWPSLIFRLCKDLGTSKDELERGETTNSITCCMRETNLPEECVRELISQMIDDTWKKINKDRVYNSSFEKSFVEIAINLARIAHCTYQHGDGHGAPDSRAKKRILSSIIEPVPLV